MEKSTEEQKGKEMKNIVWNICNLKDGEQKEACKRVLDKRLKRLRGLLPSIQRDDTKTQDPRLNRTQKRKNELKNLSAQKRSEIAKSLEL